MKAIYLDEIMIAGGAIAKYSKWQSLHSDSVRSSTTTTTKQNTRAR